MFLVAGSLLLAVNYVLVRNSLQHDRLTVAVRAPEPVAAPFGQEPLVVEGQPASVDDLQQRFRDATLSTLLLQSGQALVLMAVASLGLGWLIAGRVLKPVQDMTVAARRMSEQNLHERLALQGPDDELKELADTFDAMLARLETAFASQRRFVADASHELRTPLSIVRAHIDVALADPHASSADLRAMAETVRDATERSERLIDSLLVLARSDRGRAGDDRVAMDEVATQVLAQSEDEASNAQVSLRRDLSPLTVAGDRPLLERLVANLVENGIRYNHEGGWVEVAVFPADDEVVTRVSNTGDAVAPDEVDSLFEPFRRRGAGRAKDRRHGVGLGLSIVRSVASAHRGRVTARARTEGGLEVVVRLPGVVSDG